MGRRPGPVEHAVELTGVARARDLDVGVLPEYAQRHLESLVEPTTGVGVGDEQEGIHAATVEGGSCGGTAMEPRAFIAGAWGRRDGARRTMGAARAAAMDIHLRRLGSAPPGGVAPPEERHASDRRTRSPVG